MIAPVYLEVWAASLGYELQFAAEEACDAGNIPVKQLLSISMRSGHHLRKVNQCDLALLINLPSHRPVQQGY